MRKNALKYQGKIVSVGIETTQLPNGHICDLEVVHHPGGAAVVAQDRQQRICLIRQYRHVAGDWLWELPAGKIDQNENPLLTAQRELEEETGVIAAQWTKLGSIYSSPGVFQEIIHLYQATDLSLGQQRLGDDEAIEVHWIEREQALDWVKTNQISDAKTIAGLFFACVN